MGKHAYLIMAHKDYKDLVFLLKTIDDERNDIFIHIDKKWKDFDKNKILNCVSFSNIFFTKRINVQWGNDSLMKCEMILYKKASQRNYEYYHLLSGQDLCLRNQDYIHDFFNKNEGKEFISFCGDKKWNERIHNRMKFYYLSKRKKNNFYAHLNALSVRIQKILKIDRIKKFNYIIVGGSEWCSLTNEAVQYLIKKQRELKKHFLHTSCIDEVYKQTILFNSNLRNNFYQGDENFDSSLRYIDWLHASASGSPKTFDINDFERIMDSGNLFARKFSYEHDKEIQNKILNSIKSEPKI